MYKIIDKRGSGKTLRLMLIAKEQKAIFVCSNPDEMKVKADAYGLTDITFVSYEDIMTKKEEYQYHKIVIDEIDSFVAWCLSQNNGNILSSFSVCTDE